MPVSNELFLLSCINHSNQGKIDWVAVASECGMSTKDAAAIRFRRFKAKHDISLLNGGVHVASRDEADEDASETATTPIKILDRKTPRKTGSATKKRKLSSDAPVKDEPKDDEDDEI